MSLRETAQVLAANKPGPRCGFSQMWDALDDDDRIFLGALLADDKVSHAFIATLITTEGKRRIAEGLPGVTATEQTVSRHRVNAAGAKCGCLETHTYVAA